jgi:4-amino-4-deoxy-L-arabinose transferase-like glycosyltransferase
MTTPLQTYAARPHALARTPRVRPALLVLLLGTALLQLWDLSASGYANSFYSAAAQAGSESWKAFFFGSSDAANSITVDKPPAGLWPMDLSVRLFGLGSWQILLPQALMGVGTVAVLYAAVRRRSGPTAGLIAGSVLALTPVAAMMFRFNNPDALLALLMTVTVSCVLRALEGARTTWLLWAGVAVGFAFLTKTLQAFLILPPLAVVYAVCAPTTLRRRLGQLALAGLAVVVSGGWWVAVVELWPASSRPYIGGSRTNSFLELTFGYNGFGRISGDEAGSVGGGGAGPGGGGGRWGETGLGRMFNESVGGQISWLLPAALLLLVAGLVLTRRAARTDTARSAFLVWGGSLLMTMAVFSFMAGIFHEYYTIALAPYIAALIGMGVTALWKERAALLARRRACGARPVRTAARAVRGRAGRGCLAGRPVRVHALHRRHPAHRVDHHGRSGVDAGWSWRPTGRRPRWRWLPGW